MAILGAKRSFAMDLVVENTSTAVGLGARLALPPPADLLHLYFHGRGGGAPPLILEDAYG
jgi:hypothetical protein